MSEQPSHGAINSEIEAKFLIDDPAQVEQFLELLRGRNVTVEEASTQDIHDRYFDTPNWRLFHSGWGYRWQEADGRYKAGLKALTRRDSAVQEREEVSQSLAALPSGHDELPDGPVGDRVREIAGRETPIEIFRVHKIRRRHFLRPDERTGLELALDSTDIRSSAEPQGGSAGPLQFLELELELIEGGEEHVHQLSGILEHELKLPPARFSKYERGLQVAGRWPPPPAREGQMSSSPPPECGRPGPSPGAPTPLS